MGAIAQAFVAYAQPLLDQTDGSKEQLDHALALSQLCYNMALLPESGREQMISEIKLSFKVSDEEFDVLWHSVFIPMIQRHQEIFPQMHSRGSSDLLPGGPSLPVISKSEASSAKNPGTDRYAPCPCNSGLKYKFCCGKKRP